jgi:hypothetical protein
MFIVRTVRNIQIHSVNEMPVKTGGAYIYHCAAKGSGSCQYISIYGAAWLRD